MWLHAKLLGKGIVPAGPQMKMAAVGAHNTKIARRERLEAWITIALREAFFG
jgi:hypothetical protein